MIRVILTGGRGDELEPPPGRDLLVPSTATFAELGHGIDVAFGRWDFAHSHTFTLPDGRCASDLDDDRPEDELDSKAVLIGSVGFAAGDRFEYIFDLGDRWTHRCTVLRTPVDPAEEWGGSPTDVVANFGWGVIPDQYGRTFPDDGEVDDETGVADGTLEDVPALVEEELTRAERAGRPVRELGVDLSTVAEALEDGSHEHHWFLDLVTGEMEMVSEWAETTSEAEDRVERMSDDDRYLAIPHRGSDEGYDDMVDFIGTVRDARLRDRLELAIQGRGAFRRFKDVLGPEEGELKRWFAFRDGRATDRARLWLAEHGIRAVPKRWDATGR